MPDKTAYFSIARSVDGLHDGHHAIQTQLAIGLGYEISHAPRLVYSDGYDLNTLKLATPIGLRCRPCDRIGCNHRAFPPLSRKLIVDENMKTASPFMFHSHD